MSDSTLPSDSIQSLYREHHGWLLGWLRKRLNCPDSAADLAQDTFVRLMARPREIDRARNPIGYLRTIAQGLLIDHWRRGALERAWLETLAAQPQACAPSPERQALVLETLVQIDAMLSRLPAKPRRAFLLAQLHGLPHAAIAAELQVSERMVRKYLSQAMLHCLVLDAELKTALVDAT